MGKLYILTIIFDIIVHNVKGMDVMVCDIGDTDEKELYALEQAISIEMHTEDLRHAEKGVLIATHVIVENQVNALLNPAIAATVPH